MSQQFAIVLVSSLVLAACGPAEPVKLGFIGGLSGQVADLGMLDYADRQIGQLSGGQQQRVFIARALVQEADLYFLDEPMAGVDATTEAAIIAILQRLRDQGKTVVVVHHDLSTVKRWFDWLIMLNRRVVAQGPVATTYTRDNLRAAYGGQLAVLDPADHGLGP